jgi:4-diphosphocytidyl-2-C-methyl-D-erythritol kinase
MITFPNAKINLGLHVLRKRTDGYHEIESCLYPVTLCDVLEIIEAKSFSFQSSGLPISGDESQNLVLRAYQILQDDFDIPPVQIHLHKIIPMGAGLGGGSSDAAYALKVLNSLFDLELSKQNLEKYASQLGSDCPFFIENTPKLVTGTGTTLTPFDLDLSAYRIELAHPTVHVSTAEAYRMLTPKLPTNSLQSVLQTPVETWNDSLVNDFEAPMLSKFPEISKAKERLISDGAIYAAMTGSGSSVFGIFRQ